MLALMVKAAQRIGQERSCGWAGIGECFMFGWKPMIIVVVLLCFDLEGDIAGDGLALVWLIQLMKAESCGYT
nr:hypothetical protein [uncultured Chitinophaga sp.]